ncbi:hypothetical protein L6452_03748 [Arctium lappa]|uniref:Uncharacterized protein n=1 Tax=Arctium lappa TaxID=4217 RepID=A0ACB9FMR0_ARCLA|nr:hypothetical protein L6452_03748 [Arctium lappa]
MESHSFTAAKETENAHKTGISTQKYKRFYTSCSVKRRRTRWVLNRLQETKMTTKSRTQSHSWVRDGHTEE